jgi:uncharacterized protein
MQMIDSHRIPASRLTVWAALNVPDILRRCIPGCQSLEMTSPTTMIATVVLRIGPVKATFSGTVVFTDIDAPNSYRIIGDGTGGVAGFAKGGAKVRLEEESTNVTILHYETETRIGGKLAQLGSRLIHSTSKKLAASFFEVFANAVAPAPSSIAQSPVSDS